MSAKLARKKALYALALKSIKVDRLDEGQRSSARDLNRASKYLEATQADFMTRVSNARAKLPSQELGTGVMAGKLARR